MTRLTLHVGMPKCASTTLQNDFFGRLAQRNGFRYEGKQKLRPSTEVVSPLARSFKQYRDGDIRWERTLDTWVAKAEAFDHIVVSDEEFASWPPASGGQMSLSGPRWPTITMSQAGRTEPPPLIGFLEVLKLKLPLESSLEVVVLIRAQPEFLASLYAQTAGFSRGSGQKDFESVAMNLIQNDDPYMNWSKWFHLLSRQLGRRHVHIFPLEAGVKRITDSIARNLQLLPVAPPSSSHNVRGTDAAEWQLREYLHAHQVLFRAKRLIPDEIHHSRLLGPALRPLGSIAGQLARRFDFRNERSSNPKPRRTIRLTPKIRNQILEWQCENNERFSLVSGVPLPAPYWPPD